MCEFMQCSIKNQTNPFTFSPPLDEQGNQRTLTQESLMMNDPEQVKVAVQALQVFTFEPRREKTGLRGFRTGPTQTGLYKLRKELEA